MEDQPDPPAAAVEPRVDAGAEPPRAAKGRRRRAGLVVALVLVLVGGLAIGAYAWWSRQWYVGVHDGQVAVFQGVPDPVLGLDLSRLSQAYPVDVEDLPEFTQRRLEEGIPADDEDAARERADLLARQAAGFR
jgi:protein phosphatase